MTDDVMQTAMAAWAAKDLPARLLAGQVAKLLNCSAEDVAILVSAGKLRAFLFGRCGRTLNFQIHSFRFILLTI